MKPNTKYNKNGFECCMLPFDGGETITQFAYSNFSHAGSTAIDVTQGGTKEAYYAPVTMKCVKIDLFYHFTWWQSIQKVYIPNGIIDYVTFMFGHDETINCYVGQVIAQGTQVGNMGAGGIATGVHCHVEAARGPQNGWIKNAQGVYVLPNASLIETICFMDDALFTNVNMSDADFHYTKEIKEEGILHELPSDFIKERGVFLCNVDKINIREEPSVEGKHSNEWITKGMSAHYDGYVKREGYVWISWPTIDYHRHWMAVGELVDGINKKPYGTFR